MRERAREADMPLSRLVVELARADDPDRHALVLSEAEKRAMRDALVECTELRTVVGGRVGMESAERIVRRFERRAHCAPSGQGGASR